MEEKDVDNFEVEETEVDEERNCFFENVLLVGQHSSIFDSVKQPKRNRERFFSITYNLAIDF